MTAPILPEQVLEFWFSPEVEPYWFNSHSALDERICTHYRALWEQAAMGALDAWAERAEGALALCIVLDQFPLNMLRGRPESFRTEQQAVAVAKAAVAAGLDRQLPKSRLAFLYMPLMHSESLADQDLSVSLFEAAGLEHNAKFARHHRELIERFGRFPHRNAILGRVSTPEELRYLASPEAFTG
ncbi:MAG: DUF924 domain-containing protein [Candidatus Thiodiazotropha sp.]